MLRKHSYLKLLLKWNLKNNKMKSDWWEKHHLPKTWSKCTFHDESFNLKSWTIRDVHHHFCSTWHQCSKPVQKYNGKNIYSLYSLKCSKTCYNSDVIVQEIIQTIRTNKDSKKNPGYIINVQKIFVSYTNKNIHNMYISRCFWK